MASVPRFYQAQVGRTLVHPTLPQEDDRCQQQSVREPAHRFVVAADTQMGMTNQNLDWEIEKMYSRKAVQALNAMSPRPLFCCICGDLVEMSSAVYAGKVKQADPSGSVWTTEECDQLQDSQNGDFVDIWKTLDPNIVLVCLCGNHDVGNRPTRASIERFRTTFGDDYLAFWANGTYNIVLNSNLWSDPTAALDLYNDQLRWLEERLVHATERGARLIFVYSHHPWFLYRQDEESHELHGKSPFPIPDGGVAYIPDGYFHIPLKYRRQALELFRKYNVAATFSGHFHQNLVATTSFGMDMIVTGPLSYMLDSTGNSEEQKQPKTQGFRIVDVEHDIEMSGMSSFRHRYMPLEKDL
jgi:serine/threonine-protein phosphatase CPPED1